MFHSIVFISGPCASRPAPYSFPLRFSGRGGEETDVRLPPPDVCRTRTSDRLVPGAAQCRVRIFPFPERIRPSALLTGCSAAILSDCPSVRTPPPVDTALRPAGPMLRPPQSQSGPLWPHPTDRETHRPVSEPDPTVAGNRPFGALRLRSLPCHTAIPPRIGKGRCAPPHSAAAPRRQTADPHCPSSEHRLHRTASDTRAPMHGPRGAPNPEHASRHARSPGGGRPVRKRRREPTDAGAGLRKPVAAKTARPAARTVRRKKPGEKSPSAQTPAANERPPAGATAANRRKGPV